MEACASRFTAAEGGARLAAAARARNTIVADHTAFIAMRLLHEEAYRIRGPLSSGYQRSVYITRASRVACIAYDVSILTDLSVTSHTQVDDGELDLEDKQVLVCTSAVARQQLEAGVLNMCMVNVLIIDSCHMICEDDALRFIMNVYKESDETKRPRILAMTYPLFSSPKTHPLPQNDQKDFIQDEATQKSLPNDQTDFSQIGKTEKSTKIDQTEDILSNTKGQLKDISGDVVNETLGVHTNTDDFDMYEKLEWKIEELERDLCCSADLAEDIDGVKRYSSSVTKPKELIVEYASACADASASGDYDTLDTFMRTAARHAIAFLDEHRYDPTEIYGEDLYEELRSIPDPGIEPRAMFTQFLYILDQLGPYGADKAAFALLMKLEKLKIKVPYERHFLLLCLCTSVFVKIRCYTEDIFEKYESEWEKIKLFSTPKVLRLAEILEKFKPNDVSDNDASDIKEEKGGKNIEKVLKEIEDCDFMTLRNKIEDSVNTLEGNLREIHIGDSDVSDIHNSDTSDVLKNSEVRIKNCKAEMQISVNESHKSDTDVKHKGSDFQKAETEKPKMNTQSSDQEFSNCANDELKNDNQIDKIDIEIHKSVQQFPNTGPTDKESSDQQYQNSDKQFPTTEQQFSGPGPTVNEPMVHQFLNEQQCPNSGKQFPTTEQQFPGPGPTVDEPMVHQFLNEQQCPNSDKQFPTTEQQFPGPGPTVDEPMVHQFLNEQQCPNSDKQFPTTEQQFPGPGPTVDEPMVHQFLNEQQCPNSDKQFLTTEQQFPTEQQLPTEQQFPTEQQIPTEQQFPARGPRHAGAGRGARGRGGRAARGSARAQHMLLHPDALCGTVYMKEPLMARILFMLCVVCIAARGSARAQHMLLHPDALCGTVYMKEPLMARILFMLCVVCIAARGSARAQHMLLHPDALLGTVYMKEPLMARILFMLCVEMSRHVPTLSHLCSQYSATEKFENQREFENQRRSQEDALKKFRMHECNLLLATTSLEEGVDLPRCNLVLRWDIPASYRSFGLCRGRARAPRSACVLLSQSGGDGTDKLMHNLATYKELDQIISRKCGCGVQDEPPQAEEEHADIFTSLVLPYSPKDEPNRTATNILPDSPKDEPNRTATNILPDSPKDEPNRTATNVLPDSPKDEPNRTATNILPDSPKDKLNQTATNILTYLRKDKPNRMATNILPDSPKDEPNQMATNILPDAPQDEPNRTAANILPDSPKDKLHQTATNIITYSPKDKPNRMATNILPDSPKDEPNQMATNILPDAPQDEPNRTAANILPDSPKDKLHQKATNILTYSPKDKPNRMATNILPDSPKDEPNRTTTNILPYSPKDEPNRTMTNILPYSPKDEPNRTATNILPDAPKFGQTLLHDDALSDKENYNICFGNQQFGIKDGILADAPRIEKREIKDSAEINSQNGGPDVVTSSDGVKDKVETEVNGKVLLCNKCIGKCEDVSVKCVCGVEIGKEVLRKEDKCETVASVDLSTAIALINRYCGKLPSDTFTRLAPQWWMETVQLPVKTATGSEMRPAYICTLRLPLNCPVKYNIVGHPMPTRVLARRMVALQACRILHKSGELDNQLMPIGKDNFKMAELEGAGATPGAWDVSDLARPGTTKRRQYYYKRTARAFTDCQPVEDCTDSDLESGKAAPPNGEAVNDTATTEFPTEPAPPSGPAPTITPKPARRNMLYCIRSTLHCALPERYNTRGRRLHAPQAARQALAILMHHTNTQLQIPSFPVYTRSGEVRVSVECAPDADVRITPKRAKLVRRFMRFVFAEVLRVRRRGMQLSGAARNNYYIVPTVKSTREDGSTKIDVDWTFLEQIYQHTEEKKHSELEKPLFWHLDDEEVEDDKKKAKNESNDDELSNGSDIEKNNGKNKFDGDFGEERGSGDDNKSVVENESNNEKTKCESIEKDNDNENSSDVNQRDNSNVKNNTASNDVKNESNENNSEKTDKCKDNITKNESSIDKNQDGDKMGDGRKIEKSKVKRMANPLLKPGETFVFDPEKYREAVVTPWYRNQDQPQFFLVAEICWNLTPDSAFPSATHTTFRDYYSSKYGVTLTQSDQPLLDVDHTSARLNLLTPRYVNRKGVALPVSSERTRRAKRDRLDQKQILVPELCRVHPFAAPLWFATVALPCVLYRINALLIADEIRRAVALEVGLGLPTIDDATCPGFQWPPLDFGWSLAEVLSADEKNDKKKAEEEHMTEDVDSETRNHEDILAKKDRDGDDLDDIEEEREKTINDILQEKEDVESGFEIGTWSNDMASSIPDTEYEHSDPLPPNLTLCTSASGGANWSEPVQKRRGGYNANRTFSVADSDCSYMTSDFDTDDSDLNSEGSDEDTNTSGFFSSKSSSAAMGVRIEYKTAHEAEAVDLERATKCTLAPRADETDDARDKSEQDSYMRSGRAPARYVEKFRGSVEKHKRDIIEKGLLIRHNQPILDVLPDPVNAEKTVKDDVTVEKTVEENATEKIHVKENTTIDKPVKEADAGGEISVKDTNTTAVKTVKDAIANAEKYVKDNSIVEKLVTENATAETDVKDVNTIEYPANKEEHYKDVTSLKFDEIKELFPYGNDDLLTKEGGINLETIEKQKRLLLAELKNTMSEEEIKKLHCFSMIDVDIDSPDYVSSKTVNVGFVSTSTSSAGDYRPYYEEVKAENGIFDFDYQPNLDGHPGPSPSVILQALTMSNANDGINLERLETIGDSFLKFAITAYLYCAHPTVHEGKLSHMRSKQVSNLNLYRLGRDKRLGARMIASKFEPHDNWLPPCHAPPAHHQTELPAQHDHDMGYTDQGKQGEGCFIPYNLITQHSIPDKSIADCVEALIGAYLLWCGVRGALLYMSWLGLRVLPQYTIAAQPPSPVEAPRRAGTLPPYRDSEGRWWQTVYGELRAPPSPLLRYISDPEGELERMLSGYSALEDTLHYRFRDRSLLLQALTHASHVSNRLTDCYQRLEFLGDAILDYLITRHLYEDPRRHSPGALTDLRSALVNNTIFATLCVRHGFHKYFRHMSPGLNEVLANYVRIQEENGHSISEEHYLIQEDSMEQAEDVEVPKALGDLFESVAGAIFLDSGMSLSAVWASYVRLMGAELEAFSAAAPKSPVRELLEAEPDTAKFGKPERLADGRRVRVSVEVFGRGCFKGVGRNYRIAKGTAARCALRHLRKHR